MKIKLFRRMSMATLLVIGSLLGIILGSVIAYADQGIQQHFLAVGNQNYYGHIWDDNGTKSWNYYLNHNVTMSSDKTDVTVHNIGYYSGYSSAPEDVHFGPLYIWDMSGYHSVYYSDFFGYHINGCNVYKDITDWFYGSLDAYNNNVVAQQYIWFGLGNDCTVFWTGY